MTDKLDQLRDQYDRADQDTKRDIGEYLYARPNQQISQQELTEEFGIGDSGVSRHLDEFDDDGYIDSFRESGERYATWNGDGKKTLRSWLRRVLPDRLLSAGYELRPLFSASRLGGGYIPVLLSGGFIVSGIVTAVLAIVLAHSPMESIMGLTVVDILLLTGLAVAAAATMLLTLPLVLLLNRSLLRLVSD